MYVFECFLIGDLFSFRRPSASYIFRYLLVKDLFSRYKWNTRSEIGSFENEVLENEARSTQQPNLENEAPKSRKRST